MERSFISLFFRQLYCMDGLVGVDLSNYHRPHSKPLLLQYCAAMASATRVFAEDTKNKKYLSYEHEARQLASELFDQMDIETALGLHLLSHHMLAYDLEKAEHYRDLASSICHRLQERVGLDGDIRTRISRLELVNAGVRPFHHPLGSSSEYQRLAELSMNASETPESEGVRQILLDLLHFAKEFRSLIQEDYETSVGHQVLFRAITPDQLVCLTGILDQKISFLAQKVLSSSEGLVRGALCLVRTIILYSGGQTREALDQLRQAIVVLVANRHLWSFTSPHLADLFHMCFLVAFSVRDHALASTLNQFQHDLVEFFPASVGDCVRDAALLLSITSPDESVTLSPSIDAWLVGLNES
jgi:hypothetical protein